MPAHPGKGKLWPEDGADRAPWLQDRCRLVQVAQPGLGQVAGGGAGRSARDERPRLMVQVEMFSCLFEHFILLPISLCHPYLVLWFGLHPSITYLFAEQHLREEVGEADIANELGNPTSAISAGLCTYSRAQKREEVVGHEQHKTSRLWRVAWEASPVLRETLTLQHVFLFTSTK